MWIERASSLAWLDGHARQGITGYKEALEARKPRASARGAGSWTFNQYHARTRTLAFESASRREEQTGPKTECDYTISNVTDGTLDLLQLKKLPAVSRGSYMDDPTAR